MIDFEWGEDAELVRDTAARFAGAELQERTREHESAGAVPPAVRAQGRAVGFATLAWPEAVGGAGLGVLAKAIALEELAAADPAAALALDGCSPAAEALLAFGATAFLQEVLRPLSNGGGRALLLFDDRGLLVPRGDRLQGRVPWLPSARIDLLLRLDRDGLQIVQGPGLQAEPVHGSALHAAGSAAWQVDAPVILAAHDRSAAACALAHARLHAAALMVGTMRAACEASRRYATERVAFGKPIAHHQGMAFLIVDMAMALEGARLSLHEAAWRADAGQSFEQAAAGAFLEAAEAGAFVGPNAVQIFGASGFMRDVPAEKSMRELRTLALLHGGVDAAREDAFTEADSHTLPYLCATSAPGDHVSQD